MLMIAVLNGSCEGYDPVCGTNGVTYANVCKCKEANVDVGYHGACRFDVKVEWVKKPEAVK